ncbi:MAG: NAD(P)H-dependent oxidoreductase [Bacilli bacterium]|nr:NAD(P)H-dependent oxidoreductase [Bacilli bacterium]MDD4547320.1 NAD(P)H-dependent oxidoreductase [Bacilli bacterium]
MSEKEIKIVGIAGSLRKGSFNKSALVAAQGLLPEGSSLEIVDISNLPFFNEDVERTGVPDEVVKFKDKLAKADAVLIATPEYNYSISGVLKNALDWASRGDLLPLSKKPLAIMSASMSVLGGSRVQYHLRQVCVSLDALVLNKPEVFIMKAHEKFDEEGNLTDEYTKNSISKLVKELVNLAKICR